MNRKRIDGLMLEKIEDSLELILPLGVAISYLSAFIIYLNNPSDVFTIYNTTLGTLILGLFLLRKHISVKMKIFILSSLTLCLGTLSLFESGYSGRAILLLSISALIMAGLMPRMEGILFAIATFLIHALVPLLIASGLYTYTGELMESPWEWVLHLILYATYCTILLNVSNIVKSYLLRSINELENSRDQIYRLAYHDLLTGLPNKNKFIDQMNQLKPTKGWLVLFNIRGLNLINSMYGSDAGDHVIQHTSWALSGASQSDEIVAKSGGNELVWYCLSPDNEALLHRIVAFTDEINKKTEDKTFPAKLNLNAGYVQIDSSYKDITELLRKVSMALELSKTHKTHKIMSYDSLLEEQFRIDETIKNLLPFAIAQDEITINYQEKTDCDLNKVVGVEALARWVSPVLGDVSPTVFIPILEKANLSETFGRMIIQKVLDEYPKLIEKYDSEITVSINISPSHLASIEFTEFVIGEVEKRGIDATRITLEITEDSLIESLDIIAGVLFKLRNFGFKISLDDFGTGYSSLSYLSRLGFDELKIDRSFINQLNEDSRTGMLIRTIINLKDTYGIDVVAEGVETQVQSDILKDYGCNVHQGYLFSKPTPLE